MAPTINPLPTSLKATRDGFGDAICLLGEQNHNVVVLCADLSPSTRADRFKAHFPERYFEIGISEQDMVGIAAGLARCGKVPFVSTFAVFAPGRAYDQIRLQAAYADQNIKICGSHSGIASGEDGASHQAIDDIALMRVLPNLTVLAPCDYEEAKKAVMAAAAIRGPVYIRVSRNPTPVITSPATPFSIGKADTMCEGTDTTIIACGPLVAEALLAVKICSAKGLSVGVINCHTIKPLDIQTIIEAARRTGALVTAEDHLVAGGLGSAIAETCASACPVPIEFIGVADRFGQSGTPEELIRLYGLDAEHIADAVERVIARKRR